MEVIEYKVSQLHTIGFWIKWLLIVESVLGIVGYLAVSLTSIVSDPGSMIPVVTTKTILKYGWFGEEGPNTYSIWEPVMK